MPGQSMKPKSSDLLDDIEQVVKSFPRDERRLAMLRLLNAHKGPLRLGQVARELALSPADAGKAIAEAAKDGLVNVSPDRQTVELSSLGARVAPSAE